MKKTLKKNVVVAGGESRGGGQGFLETVGKKLVPALAGVCVGLASMHDAASLAATQTVLRFPASSNPEVFEAQKALVQSWTIVRDSFVDSSKNDFPRKWENELTEALARTVSDGDNVEAAYGEIESMLETVGDPYTRFVNPKEFKDFRVKNDGELQGVGLLIASEPGSGRLVVLSPIDGSPAAKAGILPGDEIAFINAIPTRGVMDGDKASGYLRGRHGTSVTVKLARRSSQIPGVPGRPEYRGMAPSVKWRQVKLVRDDIILSPVYSEIITDKVPDGKDGGQKKERKTGYIKLTSFNQQAGSEMEKAIKDLKSEGADRFILDLRNNPGGLVNAGLDIAGMWLKPQSVVLHTVTQDGSGQTIRLGENANQLADDPLVVLVNENSASASEILAGALQDNRRAQLLGSQTFGKGKIQSVFELGQGGSGGALFVTVAKYQTPSHRNIDSVGIAPDKMCGYDVQSASFAGTDVFTADIQTDPCVVEAERVLGDFSQA